MRYRRWIAIGASIILGITFIFSGLGKLLGQEELLATTWLLPMVNQEFGTVIAYVLPWFELLLGIVLVTGICTLLAASFAFLLVTALIFYNSWMIANGLAYESCLCFGVFEKILTGELSTLDSLYMDIGLLVLVFLIFYFSHPRKFLNPRPWFIEKQD